MAINDKDILRACKNLDEAPIPADKEWVCKLLEKMRDTNPLTWNLGIPIDSAINATKE